MRASNFPASGPPRGWSSRRSSPGRPWASFPGRAGGKARLSPAAERGEKELLIVGIIGGFGFTVALFVAGEAFTDPTLQGAAKMGAMLSCLAALIAVAAGRLLKIRKMT